MTDEAVMTEVRMGTRWGRSTPLLVVGLLVIGVLISMVRSNVIAANLVVQGSEMSFSTSGLAGNDVGFGMTTMTRRRVVTTYPAAVKLPTTIRSFSSQAENEPAPNGFATAAIDGNVSTYWHSRWAAPAANYPHELVLDLGSVKSINYVQFFQRATTNGRIKGFQVYISSDGSNWGSPVKSADMTNVTSALKYTVDGNRVEGRYVRLVALTPQTSGSNLAALAEFEVWGNPLLTGESIDETLPVLRGGFASGSMDGLCISQVQSVPLLGNFTIKLTAGNGTLATSPTANEIQARNAVLDVVNLRAATQAGSAGSGIQFQGRSFFGLAAQDVTTTKTNGTFDTNPLDAPLGAGWWAIDADQGKLYAVKGKLYDADIGGLTTLPNLKITVSPTSSTPACDDTTAAYPK